jgi:micrococcal nuclease
VGERSWGSAPEVAVPSGRAEPPDRRTPPARRRWLLRDAARRAGTGGAPPDAQPARVVRVVDGDTLLLDATGPGPLPDGATRVRLLEVDAPESVAPDRPVECWGPEAADALRALAPPGSALAVAADVEPTDRFGRALLYAWTADGVLVNEALVRGGHAEAVLVGRNDRYIDRLRAAERAARDEGAGLWGACG